MNESQIEAVVMRRVRRIMWLRLIISGGVFAASLALLGLWGIGREVWVAKVFENSPDDTVDRLAYLLYAFEHTRYVVQGLVLVCVGSFFFLVREVVRAVQSLGETRA